MMQALSRGLSRGLRRAANAVAAVPLPVLAAAAVVLVLVAWLLRRRVESMAPFPESTWPPGFKEGLGWVEAKCEQGVSLADLVRTDGNIKKYWTGGEATAETKSALKKACERGKAKWTKSAKESCASGEKCAVAVINRKFPCAGPAKGTCCNNKGECMTASEAASAINQRTTARKKTKSCSLYLYQDTHFRGSLFHKNENNPGDRKKIVDIDKNKASSLKLVGKGCRVTLYSMDNGGGYRLTLPEGEYPNLNAYEATTAPGRVNVADPDGDVCNKIGANSGCWNDTANSYRLY